MRIPNLLSSEKSFNSLSVIASAGIVAGACGVGNTPALAASSTWLSVRSLTGVSNKSSTVIAATSWGELILALSSSGIW